MGIVRFYAFVKKTYPDLIQQTFKLPEDSYVEGLYIDLNSPVHTIAQKLFKYGLDRKLTAAEMELQNKFRAVPVDQRMKILFNNIGQYLFYCYNEIKPAKVFMCALDGVAPKAKMVQQRLRRFKPSGAPLDFFDPVVISPGTKFMDALDYYLTVEWPATYKNRIAPGVRIIFSSHREPGEGEHKIFEQMSADVEGAKRVRTTSSISRGFSKPYQVVVGADADLIILSLSRSNSIIFMRDSLPDSKDRQALTYLEEAINTSINPPCLPPSAVTPAEALAKYIEAAWVTVFKKGFEYVNITQIREQLLTQYIKPNDIVDFSFIAMFVGNDFLPALPEMEAVTVQGVRAMTDDDIELRYISAHYAKLRALAEEKAAGTAGSGNVQGRAGGGMGGGRGRRGKDEKPAGPPFDSPGFWRLFKEKEPTWRSVVNAKTGYLEFPNANGLLNHQKNRYEIFPLLPEPLTGIMRRYMYSRSKLDEKSSGRINEKVSRGWRPSREDMGAIMTSLILYAQVQRRIRGKMRGEGNVFLVENKTNINYVNLLTYLREIELNAMAYMEAQALNYMDLERLGRKPDKLIRLAVGVDEGNRRRASYVPSAFASLNRALAFGIYDSKYADVRLPKQQIDEMCRKWLEGAHWTLKYYADGPRSVNTHWFYPYEHSPSTSDLLRFIEKNMVVNIAGYPGIYVSMSTDTVAVEKINIEGVVRLVPQQVTVTNEQGQAEVETDYVAVTNREFTGVISVYEDEERRQIALMKTREGTQKFIDLASIQFVKAMRRLGNIPAPTKKQPTIPLPGKKPTIPMPGLQVVKQEEPTVPSAESIGVDEPEQEAIDPSKITLVESGRSVVQLDVTRSFKLAASIIQLISDVSHPYASIVESFFSIMPERTLKMMMTPELVDAVIEQISDAYPPEFEMITEGLYYENADVPKIPFLSPTRLERALDALPDAFNLEIQRFNGRKKREQILLRDEIIKTRTVAIAQGALGSGSANIEARTLKRQDLSGKGTGRGRKKKDGEETEEEELTFTTGGYGDALGGVLPQYLANIKELLDLPPQTKVKITPAEGAELAKFAHAIFQFPDQLLFPTDLPINYNNLPSNLPYREEGITRGGAIDYLGQRKLLINEILFMTKFGHLAGLVVYIGAAPGDHFQVVARMFPQHEFHLWDPSKFNVPAAIRKDIGQGNVSLFNKKFTHQDALHYRTLGIKLLFISDLRRLSMGAHGQASDPKQKEQMRRREEVDVHNDNIFQMQLVNIMNPVRTMLKFRLPFIEIGENYLYPAGQVWLQTWTKPTSAETRLILSDETLDAIPLTAESATFNTTLKMEELEGKPFRIQRITRYTLSEYENKLYYHNFVVRPVVKIQNGLGITAAEVPFLQNNFDGSYEVYVWDQWLLTKYPTSTASDRKGAIIILMNETTAVLGKGLDFQPVAKSADRLFTINF